MRRVGCLYSNIFLAMVMGANVGVRLANVSMNTKHVVYMSL